MPYLSSFKLPYNEYKSDKSTLKLHLEETKSVITSCQLNLYSYLLNRLLGMSRAMNNSTNIYIIEL